MHLPEYFAAAVRSRQLLPRGARVLVAVSGGVDSMVLLHLLHALAPAHGWRLTAAHFNHQLRGRSSDADERLVRATAKKLGVPFAAGRAEVRRFAAVRKISIEMAARELRHGFLARTARARKCSAIALAHHADDQVELFFLRLLRGSGGEGLAGMKWHSPSPADAKVRLVRPLLGVAKADLERFARENKIKFRADASNASPDVLRNRIRGELLPLLRKNYQPTLTRTVLRAMDIVGAEAEVVAAAARSAPGSFARLPVAVQRRRLQQQLLGQKIAPEFELIEKLRGAAGAAVTVSPQLQVWRDASGAVRQKAVERSAEHRLGQLRFQYSSRAGARRSGNVNFSGVKISWRVAPLRRFVHPKPVAGREMFDADKVGARIVLRHWRAGDRFQPIGMAAAVKLQDLFVNAKIPRARRHGLIVATTAGGEIFWVEGLRLGERFKLAAATRRSLRWSWRRA